jgi:hypothetical protein
MSAHKLSVGSSFVRESMCEWNLWSHCASAPCQSKLMTKSFIPFCLKMVGSLPPSHEDFLRTVARREVHRFVNSSPQPGRPPSPSPSPTIWPWRMWIPAASIRVGSDVMRVQRWPSLAPRRISARAALRSQPRSRIGSTALDAVPDADVRQSGVWASVDVIRPKRVLSLILLELILGIWQHLRRLVGLNFRFCQPFASRERNCTCFNIAVSREKSPQEHLL